LRRPVESAQYTAVLFTGRCELAGITPSTGSKGDCFDNAVCESFHASLKKELIYRHSWPTRAEARTAIFEYIEGWFNPRRRHSTLGYLSPAEYEHQHQNQSLPTTPDTPPLSTPTIA
jgi:putative transposase